MEIGEGSEGILRGYPTSLGFTHFWIPIKFGLEFKFKWFFFLSFSYFKCVKISHCLRITCEALKLKWSYSFFLFSRSSFFRLLFFIKHNIMIVYILLLVSTFYFFLCCLSDTQIKLEFGIHSFTLKFSLVI